MRPRKSARVARKRKLSALEEAEDLNAWLDEDDPTIFAVKWAAAQQELQSADHAATANAAAGNTVSATLTSNR